jgi:hypothetical protein
MNQVSDKVGYKTRWTIRRYASDEDYQAGRCYSESEIEGNLLLNGGIANVLDLACGLATPDAYDNTNARLGVGESTTAADATQAGLQGSSKTFKAMESGYPQRSAQTVTFRSVFGSTDANNAWQEFVVDNSTATEALNRKVSDQGTKASGQTWTLDLAITLS